jgi:hypothetical protein
LDVQVCLEVGPRTVGAFIPDHPGCWVFGRNQESALRKAKVAVSEWYTWLEAHGEKAETPLTVRTVPNEILHVTYDPAEAGKPEPLFWSEVLPISTKDINRTLRLMEYSRDDLLRLISEFDRGALNWKPKDEPRSVGNCLKHIAIVEWWYVTRLNIDLPGDFPRNVFQLLHYTRQLAMRSLRRLSKEERTGIFQPRDDPSPICNLWTARKVLRRFVDHERLHANYIRRIVQLYQWKN